ncbi:hypothetical protein GOBAR_DD16356 [Gossypium barbadense]|nr:hypothetical protein GOBAR_DD16356 [Gossypium barbadense]
MDCSLFCRTKLCFFNAFFFLFIISSFTCFHVITGTAIGFDYGVHCNSVVHESKPADEETNIMLFSQHQSGYFSGGDNVLNNPPSRSYFPSKSKALIFETHHVFSTDVEDVFKVEGNLIFQTSFSYEQSIFPGSSSISSLSDSSNRGTLDFDFRGFWSRITGKLCMVGSSYAYSKEGKVLHLAAALQINNLKNSSTIRTLATGTMDSLNSVDDPNYFERISLLMFPHVNYTYIMVSKQFSEEYPRGTHVQPELSLRLSRTRTICNMFSGGGNAFELEYTGSCEAMLSNWSILVVCSNDRLSLRFLIEFWNNSYRGYYGSPNISTSLIGEGSWDEKKNRLHIVACRIYYASSSLDKSHVGDCTTRLSLRFPAILSIRNTSTIVGEIWSVKPWNESGFFDRVQFRYGGRIQLQGLKYEYMQMDKVKKSCPMKNPRTSSNRGQYPYDVSPDMRYRLLAIEGSKGRIGWGSLDPLAVGDQQYQRFPFLLPSSSSKPNNPAVESDSNSGLLNISYKISITLSSSKLGGGLNPVNDSSNESLRTKIRISAEGVYDIATGSLCMVGCRHLRSSDKSSSSDSMDCEILVKINFPPLNSDMRNKIQGSIQSMREKTDPLSFKPLQFSGRSDYRSGILEQIVITDFESRSIWRMNFYLTTVQITFQLIGTLLLLCQLCSFRYNNRRSIFPSEESLILCDS